MNSEILNRILKCVDVEYAVDLVQKMVRTPSVVGEEGSFGVELSLIHI